jgi:hypothetical protein
MRSRVKSAHIDAPETELSQFGGLVGARLLGFGVNLLRVIVAVGRAVHVGAVTGAVILLGVVGLAPFVTVVGLVVGLTVQLVVGLMVRLVVGLTVRLVVGLVVGIFMGLVVRVVRVVSGI